MQNLKSNKVVIAVLVLAVFAAGVAAAPFLSVQLDSLRRPSSPEEALKLVVRRALREVDLPHKNDTNTTLVGLRADTEEMALVYQLEIRNVIVTDEEELRESIKKGVKNLCKEPQAGAAMQDGIHFKWVHHFVDANKAYVTTLFASDCPSEKAEVKAEEAPKEAAVEAPAAEAEAVKTEANEKPKKADKPAKTSKTRKE